MALTERAEAIVTVHDPLPAQAPAQPPNTDPAAGTEVSATEVPLPNAAEQVLPQLMPDGPEVTVPLPAPPLVTVRE